jgi:hypothetical protein
MREAVCQLTGHGEEGGETELVPLPAGILPSLPPLLVPRDDSEKPHQKRSKMGRFEAKNPRPRARSDALDGGRRLSNF